MASTWRIVWQLGVPAAVLAAGGATCAWLAGSISAATAWLVACLLTAALQGSQVVRHRAAALSQLRLTSQGELDLRRAGVFQPVVEDARSTLARQHAMLGQAQESTVDLEARSHIRHKHAQRIESALHAISDPVFVFDGSLRLVYANTAAGLFIRAAGGTGNDWTCLPELSSLLDAGRWKASGHRTRAVEFCRTENGHKRMYRATAQMLAEEGGASSGFATVVRDVSKDAEQKSHHAEFVSCVCHELKTPLAGIKAFVEMLMDGDAASPEEQQRLYGFIDVQVDRLTRLVNNMLDLARIESGVMQVRRENVHLNDVLRKALDVVRPMADEKSVSLSAELSEVYIGVHADGDLLGQAVINLLSNAVKYTPEGGQVWLRSRQDDWQALIEVEDTGMGIPDEDQQKVFQRFFRVEQNSHAAAGTGLGLALVQNIVQDIHNGQVSLRSKVGQGTCFTIALPLGHRGATRRAVGTATWIG